MFSLVETPISDRFELFWLASYLTALRSPHPSDGRDFAKKYSPIAAVVADDAVEAYRKRLATGAFGSQKEGGKSSE